MDFTLVVTDNQNPDFLRLTRQLADEYVTLFGAEALDYCPMEALDDVCCAVVAYDGKEAAASGALRRLNVDTAELLRIYVRPEYRRRGLGARVIGALEREAKWLGFSRIALYTGSDMPDAISLYQRLGYAAIPGYGSHCGDEICVYFGKHLG